MQARLCLGPPTRAALSWPAIPKTRSLGLSRNDQHHRPVHLVLSRILWKPVNLVSNSGVIRRLVGRTVEKAVTRA